MRFVALMVVVLSALPAQSQENLPTAENLRVAAECGALIATLAPRADELKKRFDAFNAEVEAATGAKRRGTIYELGKQVPTREQMDRFEATLRDLKDRADELTAGCQNLATRQQALAIEGGLSHREEFCRNWYASLNQRVDCTSWKRLGQAFWPGRASCDAEPRRFGEGAGWWPQFRRNWEKASAKQDKAAALEALYLSPASGNARERAIVVPRKFVTQSDGGPRKGPGARVVDTRALFAATHPSRFVFLRKNLKKAPESVLDGVPVWFSRTLKKGEGVIPTRDCNPGERTVCFVAIDGNSGVIPIDDLAGVPLPGTSPMPLTAEDLNILDEKGAAIAGPSWIESDATGFNLDEPQPWLELLDPPEPRTTRFLEAKTRTLECYQAQMDRLDPRGELRRHYDVVTYGRNGIERTESAATNLDRKACSACKCKAFNDLKRGIISEVLAPGQKKAWVDWDPIVKQLKSTDFAGASKAAPRGADDWGGRGI